MAPVNKNHLNRSIGHLYVAPINAGATLVKPLDDGSNAKEALTAFETAYSEDKWIRVASIVGLEISEDFAANKTETITDDTGLINSFAKTEAIIKAKWYESRNPDVIATIAWVNAQKDPKTGTATDLYIAYNLTNHEVPRFAVRVDGLIGGKKEKYYFSDATISGQIMTRFLKHSGELEGSDIEIKASEGGFVLKKLPVLP